MASKPVDQHGEAVAPPALPDATAGAAGAASGDDNAAAGASDLPSAPTAGSWKEFNPADEFTKAYKLVGPPVGAIVADPAMEVIYNKITNDHEQLVVCRKQRESGLYEYHISGVFPLNAEAIFNAQSDLAYRLQWDEYMKSYELLDTGEGGMELLRWVVAFPWPFHAREYILRRWKGVNKDVEGGVCYSFIGKIFPGDLAEVGRSTKKHCLVERWETLQVYQAVSEHACKFYNRTFSDPKMSIPKPIVNWFAKTGIPKFQKKLVDSVRAHAAYRAANPRADAD